MKNVVPTLLGILALSVCCGAPLILGSISLASLGWFVSGPGIALLIAIGGVVGVIIWTCKRRKDDCSCEKHS